MPVPCPARSAPAGSLRRPPRLGRLVFALQAELRPLALVRALHLDLQAQVVRAVGLAERFLERDLPRAVELVERLVERARAVLGVRLDRALQGRELALAHEARDPRRVGRPPDRRAAALPVRLGSEPRPTGPRR